MHLFDLQLTRNSVVLALHHLPGTAFHRLIIYGAHT